MPRSRLEALAKDNPEYRGNGGLMKKVIQRLTVGTRIATTKHSVTKNSTQLRHDLRHGPSHVFGDHTNCSKDFCTFQQNPSAPDDESNEEDQPTVPTAAEQTIEEQTSTIIKTETELQISPHDEHDAAQGEHASLINNLAPGLFNAVAKCTDWIVSLAPQLVSNQTSNLAESYMSIRSMMDRGKQFNRVQSGSFQHRCTAAGLATQHDPNWTTSFWKAATKQNSGPVLGAHTSAKVQKLEQDHKCKQTVAYKQQRRSTWNKNSTATTGRVAIALMV